MFFKVIATCPLPHIPLQPRQGTTRPNRDGTALRRFSTHRPFLAASLLFRRYLWVSRVDRHTAAHHLCRIMESEPRKPPKMGSFLKYAIGGTKRLKPMRPFDSSCPTYSYIIEVGLFNRGGPRSPTTEISGTPLPRGSTEV